MREYESCFALLIRDFIAYRKASGRWNEASYGPNPVSYTHLDVYKRQVLVDPFTR